MFVSVCVQRRAWEKCTSKQDTHKSLLYWTLCMEHTGRCFHLGSPHHFSSVRIYNTRINQVHMKKILIKNDDSKKSMNVSWWFHLQHLLWAAEGVYPSINVLNSVPVMLLLKPQLDGWMDSVDSWFWSLTSRAACRASVNKKRGNAGISATKTSDFRLFTAQRILIHRPAQVQDIYNVCLSFSS